MHALGLEFGSAAQLSKRPGSVWNCLWGNALKRSPGIIRKSRVLYPGPGFLSSATWPSLPKKHYNGLNQTKPNHRHHTLLKPLSCIHLTHRVISYTVCVSEHLLEGTAPTSRPCVIKRSPSVKNAVDIFYSLWKTKKTNE